MTETTDAVEIRGPLAEAMVEALQQKDAEIERLRAALLWVDTAVAVGRWPVLIRIEIAKVLAR